MLPEWFFVDYCSIFCGSSHSMHICYHCCLSHTESVGPTTGFKVYCWKTVAWCAYSVCERAAGCILCLTYVTWTRVQVSDTGMCPTRVLLNFCKFFHIFEGSKCHTNVRICVGHGYFRENEESM